MSKKFLHKMILLIVVLLGLLFQGPYFNTFPSHTHAWTQSDRYALAHGFVNNGLDFFHPETYYYHPPDSLLEIEVRRTSVTSVDFPIHDYIPAVAMRVLGTTAPWVFRFYIFLMSVLGLFYLFKLSFQRTEDALKSIFVVVFAATSPVFVFYQAGFLPTIPSLSLAMAGIYYYSRYFEKHQVKSLRWALLFLTLAALGRTTFAIPLIAVTCLEVLLTLLGRTKLKRNLIAFGCAYSSIIIYAVYNASLKRNYGSIFLGHIMPAKNFEEALIILIDVQTNWLFAYFSQAHYLFFSLLAIAVVFIVFRKGITAAQKHWFALVAIMLFGCIGFASLMLKQFTHHDYYFLDTFFLPIILFVIGLLAVLPPIKSRKQKLIGLIVFGFTSIPMVYYAMQSQTSRRATGSWDYVGQEIENFSGSKQFLDTVGVAPNSELLMLNSFTSNIPFLFMDRKGYTLIRPEREDIIEALDWDFDYIIIQNKFFMSEIYDTYPDILSRIQKVWDNGKISVCKLSASHSYQSLEDFLSLDEEKLKFETVMNFDSLEVPYWTNAWTGEGLGVDGTNAGIINPSTEFGATFKSKELQTVFESKSSMLFEMDVFTYSSIVCDVVVAVQEKDKSIYYRAVNLNDMVSNTHTWQPVTLFFELPQADKDSELAVYLWNPEKSDFVIDNMRFKIFSRK